MAPKQVKGSKRPAPKRENSAPAPPAKKPKLPSEVQALHDVVAAAGLPDDCRDMILAALPSSFIALASERHEIQRAIVAIVGDIIDSTGAQIGQRVDSARERVAELDRIREQLQATIGASETARDGGSQLLEDCKAALAKATANADEATQKMQEAEEAKQRGDEVAAVERADLDILSKAMETELPQLTNGEDTLPSADEVNDKVRPLLRLLELDKSLVIALPSACAKKADVRGAFDKMVIEQLMTSLKDKVTELTDKSKIADEANASLAAALEAAKDAVASATEQRCVASKDVDDATKELETKEANLATARGNLDAHVPALTEAKVHLEACEAELQNFECYTLECFKSRRDADKDANPDVPSKADEAREVAEAAPVNTAATECPLPSKSAQAEGLACDVQAVVNIGGA